MHILVIDAKGGGLGRQLVAAIKDNVDNAVVTAVGTNSMAMAAMKKAKADNAATGENSVVVCCKDADIIVGPIGIVLADSMNGEITPAMAQAVCKSRAKRIFVPMNHCDNVIVGLADLTIKELIQDVIKEIKNEIESENSK